MIILRAFPFSLSIYWRMLCAFPFMVLALVVLSGLTVLLALVLSQILPAVIVTVLIFGLCMSFYTTPILLGMRMGLSALGHTARNTLGGLWGYAAMYGLFIALLTIVVTAIAIAIAALVSDVSALISNLSAQTLMLTLMTNKTAIYSVMSVATIIPFCIFAALMLPMAASSIGTDSNGESHTPFAGFGTGFLPLVGLLLVVQIWNGALTYALPVVFAQFAGDGALSNMVAATLRYNGGELPRNTGIFVVGFILPYLLCILWTISLQCAGAVLVYADACNATPTPPAPPQTITPEDSPAIEDIGAMWRSRMPKPQ